MTSSPSEATPYGLRDVERLSGAPEAQLRRWHKSGLLPALREGGQLRYRFADVIAARTARALIEQGMTTRRVREAVEAVRAWRPDVPHPLASLRVVAEGGELLVRIDDQLVHGRSGQLLLDLPLSEELPTVRPAPVETLGNEAPTDADGWVEWARSAELAGEPVEVVQGRYAQALALDPLHPGALIGAGNGAYATGRLPEAKTYYERATRVAGDHPHPWYNLANVLDDQGHVDAAAAAYRTALARDPDFADAHFNLALLWEKHGQRGRAEPHWARVVDLEPDGEAATLARRFLADPTDR